MNDEPIHPTSNELIASLRDGDSKFRIAAPRSYDGTLARAAEEIDRLTRERDVWKSKAVHRGESASRLRAALEKLLAGPPTHRPFGYGGGEWVQDVCREALSGEPSPVETTAGQDPSPLGCGLPWPTCETCTAWHDVVADPIGPGTRNGECRLEPKPVAVTSTYWCRNWQGPKRTPGAPPLKASGEPHAD